MNKKLITKIVSGILFFGLVLTGCVTGEVNAETGKLENLTGTTLTINGVEYIVEVNDDDTIILNGQDFRIIDALKLIEGSFTDDDEIEIRYVVGEDGSIKILEIEWDDMDDDDVDDDDIDDDDDDMDDDDMDDDDDDMDDDDVDDNDVVDDDDADDDMDDDDNDDVDDDGDDDDDDDDVDDDD